jgi:hypothetical protein
MAHSATPSGVLPNASLRSGSSTTATCNASESAIDAHSQRLVNSPANALECDHTSHVMTAHSARAQTAGHE